jgi:hypothetical protein
MADKDTAPTKKLEGFDVPVKQVEGKPLPAHVSEHTLMAKGIDPDTKERLTISLDALKAEFGEEKAAKIYSKAAVAGGFLNPDIESRGGSHYFPDLSLDGMNPEARKRVDAILSAKE